MTENVDFKKRQKTIHEMWMLYFNTHVDSNKKFDADSLRMFWNQMGWLGNNKLINPEDFEQLGFLMEATEYISRYVEEVGPEQTVEEIEKIVDFVEDNWSSHLENEVPKLRQAIVFEAQDGEINGSLSVE